MCLSAAVAQKCVNEAIELIDTLHRNNLEVLICFVMLKYIDEVVYVTSYKEHAKSLSLSLSF